MVGSGRGLGLAEAPVRHRADWSARHAFAARMEATVARNIVLLSDGTGNSSAKLFKTNVYRLYEALDRSDPKKQVAYYDDGIGTSSFRPLAALGGVFGFGLKRNVLDLYRFLCRNYEKGDRIFCFGFSRGAFTARVVAGLIASEGVVKKDPADPDAWDGIDEDELARQAAWAYRHFRRQFKAWKLVDLLRTARDAFYRWRHPRKACEEVAAIQFVGVWDTVAAYGGPIEEMTRAIDHFVWPLSMPDRKPSDKLRRGCHAIALDDERNSFHPLLWDESDEEDVKTRTGWEPPADPDLAEIDRQRLSQVWFTGMHSDVGGGYAQDGLSFKTLEWMMDRASVHGLLFEPNARRRLLERAPHLDKVNNSRKGVGAYYRYKPRRMDDILSDEMTKPEFIRDVARMAKAVRGRELPVRERRARVEAPMIHESVLERISGAVDGYAPIVLPPRYRVTGRDGRIGPVQAASAAWVKQQEVVFDRVWMRRLAYFLTLFATLYLVALPIFPSDRVMAPQNGASTPQTHDLGYGAALIPPLELIRKFVPSFAGTWIDAFEAAPLAFALGATLVLIGLRSGRALDARIADGMRAAWHPNGNANSGPPSGFLYELRTSQYYRGFFYALTHWILPAVIALLIYAAALAAVIVPIACFFGGEAARSCKVCVEVRAISSSVLKAPSTDPDKR